MCGHVGMAGYVGMLALMYMHEGVDVCVSMFVCRHEGVGVDVQSCEYAGM